MYVTTSLPNCSTIPSDSPIDRLAPWFMNPRTSVTMSAMDSFPARALSMVKNENRSRSSRLPLDRAVKVTMTCRMSTNPLSWMSKM